MSNGFYTFSDSYLKNMRKQDLINYIRTIEKNWENALVTNDIQYHNCKKLLAEERNKAIDEFTEALVKHTHKIPSRCLGGANILEIAEQMKAGGMNG